MKTLTEFIREYEGEYVNYDAMFGPQCMDLFRQYVRDVLGFPQSPGVRNAWQVFYNYPVALWEKTPYKRGMFPSPGDVVIWSRWLSPSLTGHIAICVSADVNKMTCFSQNDPPKNDKSKKFAIVREYDYSRFVLGWLRPKVQGVE